MKRKISLILIIAVIFSLSMHTYAFDASWEADRLIADKKTKLGYTDLLSESILDKAGTTEADWYAIALSRHGAKDDYDAYRAMLKEYVTQCYQTPQKLHAVKATEWHRISLAALACGGDPTDFGGINLIADGTYNRGLTVSLGQQGINGWIWALIALDSMNFQIPEGAFNTRDDIIAQILARQLPDGGFALTGSVSDPDMTSMALIALAPYYNSENIYTLENEQKSVHLVIDEALLNLSAIQGEDGSYSSWGVYTAESTAQVIQALCSLGIDPLTDTRFIKNGSTTIDALEAFKISDGAYAHSKGSSENSMATQQALCALVALDLFQHNERAFYDFRPEMSEETKTAISDLTAKISSISSYQLDELMQEYENIPQSERRYVYNYRALSDAVKLSRGEQIEVPSLTAQPKASVHTPNTISPEAEFPTTEIKYKVSKKTDEADENIQITEAEYIFSEDDMNTFRNLPEKLTTKEYPTVVSLCDKIETCADFEGKEDISEKLHNDKKIIQSIQKEIDDINELVSKSLYPFDSISLKDRDTVLEIVERINDLSEYDRTKINYPEDIEKALTQVNSLYRAQNITIALIILTAAAAIALIMRIIKRRKAKAQE